jgi:hypothetical protein
VACACKGRSNTKFLWYDPSNPEGAEPVIYKTEVEAKAKVMRKGGTYITHNPNLSIGQQIVLAEQSAGQAV